MESRVIYNSRYLEIVSYTFSDKAIKESVKLLLRITLGSKDIVAVHNLPSKSDVKSVTTTRIPV